MLFQSFQTTEYETFMIAVGSDAPDFKLESQFDTEYSLSQFKGDKNVMLVFYPKDWTPT